MKLKRYLGFLGVGLILLLVYRYVSTPLVVTVTGTGEVSVPAGAATISFTLSELNANPSMAVSNLNDRAEVLRALLVQNGVVESEIVASQSRVVPAGLVVAGATGYQATMTMGGKTKQLNNITQLTAVLYEKGATLVSQPVLSVEDQALWEEKAMIEALTDAKKKAGQIQKRELKLFKTVGGVATAEPAASGTVSSRSEGEVSGEGLSAAGSDTIKIGQSVQVTYRMW